MKLITHSNKRKQLNMAVFVSIRLNIIFTTSHTILIIDIPHRSNIEESDNVLIRSKEGQKLPKHNQNILVHWKCTKSLKGM